MADEIKSTPRKPRRLLRWIGVIFGLFVLLLVVAYFVGTSEWALKSIVLPKVSKAMNAQVTVESASISPFSSVELRGLKVQTTGTDPLVTAQQVRARYSLMDIIKGNLHVNEVTLDSPVVNLVTFPDGTSNLDPITRQPGEQKPRQEPKDRKSGKTPQVSLQKFSLNNATVRKIDQRKDGTRQLLELTGVNVTAANIGNNKTGQLGLAARVHMDQGLNSASNGVLAAAVTGMFNVQLDSALKPQVAKGETKVDVTEARGGFAQVAGLNVVLNTDLTPTQLNDLSVRLAQNGKPLGAITVKGPFNAETSEGKLAVAISQIDRQVLNIAGAAMGIDFNQTAINSTNTIELAQKGRVISVNGQLIIGNFSVTQKGQTTPALDMHTSYAVTYDQTNKSALVQTFTVNGTQNNAEFLRGTLARPMLLELGKASGAVDESAFDLVVTNFNLPDWKAFFGTNVSLASGKLGVTLNLVSQQGGKKLSLNLATQLRDLSAGFGSNRIDSADIGFSTRGTVQDFSAVNLESYRADLTRGGQPALTASGALQYNTRTQDADVQANLETSLPQVAALVAVPGLAVSAGTLKFAGHIVQKNTTPQQTNNPVLDRSVTGKLNLDNFTGAFQSNRFDRFVTALDLDVAMRGDAVDIRKCSGALRQSDQPGGSFEVTGNYNLAKKAGDISAQLTDLNQNVLKSFLAAALGDKQLESVAINSKTTAKLDGPDDMVIKTELHVANLVVNDPSGQVPKAPLAVDLNADVSRAKNVIDLKMVQLALTKTERAPNSINVNGRIDQSKSNAWTGNLKIASDGLDLTTYYDLFAKKQTNATQTTKTSFPASQPKEAKTETEPTPINIPFAQFNAEMNIAKIFLREVAISNLMSKTVIDNGHVNVNPFSLTLNGAPVNLTALLNLAVAGYEYDVNAKLDRVPIEPLVNTFAPDKRGQMKGDLLTRAQIKGAGVTGKSLQKNLGGQIGLTLTNANVQVTDNKYAQMLLSPLAGVLKTPELAQSPLTWINAQIGIGDGTVTVTNAIVRSSLFSAGVNGTISLKDVLTNSTFNNLPVQIALVGSVAKRVQFLSVNSESNFVPLPQFYAIGGTLGKPNPHIDQAALVKSAASEAIGHIGGDAGKLLRGLSNLGGGTSTNATGANAPATNSTGNLLQGLGTLLQKPARTNAPATDTPKKKKSGGLLDLIK